MTRPVEPGAGRRGAERARTAEPVHVRRLGAAVGEPGCPICRCVEADARRNLAAWLREQTMDPAGRATLCEAGGLCAWHAGMLADAADGILSVALVAEDLLARAPASRAPCPACVPLARQTEEYLAR